MTRYDPVVYWRKRGPTYEQRLAPGLQDEQERVLLPILAALDFRSVLDVGCGYGRLAEKLAAIRPEMAYTGIDVSPDLLGRAKARHPAGEYIESSIADFSTRRKWDLVLCVQVLMHIPPSDVQAVTDKLLRASRRYVVTCDWTKPRERKVGASSFLHDYRALLSPTRVVPVGLQSVFVVER